MKKSNTKSAMLSAATKLFRDRGYEGVGIAKLLQSAGAPRGSLYFHFPGGKEQIGVETVELVANVVIERMRARNASGPSPEAYIEGTFDAWAEGLANSDFRNGCLVAIIALEMASVSEPLHNAARTAFERWEEETAKIAQGWGLSEADARTFATALMIAVEGAIVVARARSSTQPFKDSARAMKALAAEMLGAVRPV